MSSNSPYEGLFERPSHSRGGRRDGHAAQLLRHEDSAPHMSKLGGLLILNVTKSDFFILLDFTPIRATAHWVCILPLMTKQRKSCAEVQQCYLLLMFSSLSLFALQVWCTVPLSLFFSVWMCLARFWCNLYVCFFLCDAMMDKVTC